ncbi:MAG: PEP-CTERM sorting domain-containing protein [bacterium]
MMKNFAKKSLLVLACILLPCLSSISEAVPLTFSDSVINPGSPSYVHVLNDNVIVPADSDGETATQSFTIDSAILTINADINLGTLDAHPDDLTLGMSVIRTSGNSIFMGRRVFLSRHADTVLKSQILQFRLTGPVLEALGSDLKLQVDLTMNPLFGGSIRVNESTLSGIATMVPVPEPSSLLLVGSGILGLFSVYRRRG